MIDDLGMILVDAWCTNSIPEVLVTDNKLHWWCSNMKESQLMLTLIAQVNAHSSMEWVVKVLPNSITYWAKTTEENRGSISKLFKALAANLGLVLKAKVAWEMSSKVVSDSVWKLARKHSLVSGCVIQKSQLASLSHSVSHLVDVSIWW